MVSFDAKSFRMWSMMGINPSVWSVAFPEVLRDVESAVALTADLGRYSGMMRTWRQFPDRFYNVGIAEQNMVGIAAGMAMCGHQVYMTTYAPFMSYRCADQLRHLLGNHNLDIKAIGSAAGLSGGMSGSSLLSLGDIALMRTIPNMTILNPADCAEAVKMLLEMAKHKGPVYMRFGGAVNIPMVYKDDYEFKIGRAYPMRMGERVLIVSTGTTIVAEAMKAAEIINNERGFMPAVVNFPTIKPLDCGYLRSAVGQYEMVVTIEEHSIYGGLGSAVAECLAEFGQGLKVKIIGVPDRVPEMGSRPFMLERCGLTAAPIARKIIETMEESR